MTIPVEIYNRCLSFPAANRQDRLMSDIKVVDVSVKHELVDNVF